MKKFVFTLLICTFISGCKDKIYDVSYYSEHLDEASSVIAKCKAGEVTDDNCKNAQLALDKKKGENIRKKLLQ
ncbi:EexN family lipoprotein [Citrobacter portucalensis]|uniref:EexN family lipoprotein n=1 Tax=Salmonella enterica TaxID=28901 RepID=A0A763UXG2_SALER|nr:EexN family lipoprotein [Citrobacter portucalensis]EBL9679041.1 hypothetical protein [Salmonella enterica]ECG8601220.1 hypothetical protein [Salmonella enterica subsp. salamae]EEX9260443.1 EexN family lipoprotein [Escherichia coli]HCQ6561098.1 EexN family lipoprotein [Citrobacter freundii]EMC3311287.1 EexN family lipoprotein [Salmonella enterica]